MSLGRYIYYPMEQSIPRTKTPGAAAGKVGWRSWLWDEEAGLLRSLGEGPPWLPGEPFRAVCEASRPVGGHRVLQGRRGDPAHTAPQPCCECGIHAYKQPEDVDVLWGEVTGTCELWGTVLDHDRGYRASHAYPLELQVQTDGAAGGKKRAASIAERLRSAYGVPVRVLGYEEVDDVLASTLRDTPPPRGLARISRIAWTARELHDGGEQAGALEIVLGELRRLDLRALNPGGQMGQGLRAPFFLHERENRRWVRSVEKDPGAQVVTVVSLKGQAAAYHGPQYVELDTRNGNVVERIEQCAGPRHRGHQSCRTSDDQITIMGVGSALRLESWIQVLFWASDPYILASAASLRTQRPTLGFVYAATALLRRPRKIRIGKWPE